MRRKLTILAIATGLAATLWFLGVDRSWFVENCPACGLSRDIEQYRIFTISIHEKSSDHVSLLQRVAKDMGAECKHPGLIRWHMHRFWGLCICAAPCINGTFGIVFDTSWYDETAAARLKDWVREVPSVRDEFIERALQKKDPEFLRDFFDHVRKLRDN
jgi:hypothetical protein